MGVNAQTSVPLYAASEVLTAANMNISAGTGVPVFATTVTRDAAFGGANEKVLAEGQLCYLESTNVVQYYDGAAWATVGPSTASGLTLITAQTIGTAVSSVAVTGVFSATYDAYKIIVSGGSGSAQDNINLILGSTTTGYYAGVSRVVYSSAAASPSADNNAANFARVGSHGTDGIIVNCDLVNPNLAKKTFISGTYIDSNTAGTAGAYGGFLNNTTAYTAFTITPGAGTLTGGTIRVYGYQNS